MEMLTWLNNFSGALYNNFIRAGRWKMFLNGFLCTIQISVGAVILGIIIGFIIAFLRIMGDELPTDKARIRIYLSAKSAGGVILYYIRRILYRLAGAYIDVIRGTPAITQLLIISVTIFGSARGVNVWIGIVSLGINSGAYVCEIIRAGILSVDHGQTEAGLSLGFNRRETYMYIIIPQAVKNILPALANEFINLIKETAIVGYIAVNDLTKIAQLIVSRTFNVLPLFGAALMYFLLIKALTVVMRTFEKRLRASDKR